MDFDDLVAMFRDNGYFVTVREDYYETKSYRFAEVTGKKIYAGFCESNGHSYPCIDGKIAADHSDCFDKWSKCPLKLTFPADKVQQARLLALLERLGSLEGYKESNSYAYLGPGNNPYYYEEG